LEEAAESAGERFLVACGVDGGEVDHLVDGVPSGGAGGGHSERLASGSGGHAGELADRMALRGYDAVHLAAAHTLRNDDHVVVATDLALRNAAAASGLTTAPLS
jgi:hypothetical protein